MQQYPASFDSYNTMFKTGNFDNFCKIFKDNTIEKLNGSDCELLDDKIFNKGLKLAIVSYTEGGITENNLILNSCEVFNFQTHTWYFISDLEIPRCTFFSFIYGEYIYVCGGYNGNKTRTEKIEFYDFQRNVWQISDFKLNRGLECGNYIYVIGGRIYGKDEEAILQDCEKFNIKEKKWEKMASLNYKRCSSSAFEVQSRLYVTGGYSGDQKRECKFEFYNEQADFWELMAVQLNQGIEGAFCMFFKKMRTIKNCLFLEEEVKKMEILIKFFYMIFNMDLIALKIKFVEKWNQKEDIKNCKRGGCQQKYTNTDNHPQSCHFHPGKPIFHDTKKGWTCCNQIVYDWDEFQKIKPCAEGMHCDQDPNQSLSGQDQFYKSNTVANAQKSLDKQENKIVIQKISDFNKHDENKQQEKKNQAQNEVNNNQIKEKQLFVTINGNLKCVNKGCQKEYKEEENNENACIYHSGNPIFHDLKKYWSCCQNSL
ncbi:kelch motif family protein, putative [Ichthyophthirius multifiliis]|uniref:Kelch motif family protein, putative n=1 Tax=Ichthyophthirius multifiliis TaxID=5932 RepID=G0QTQ8_ICHMU|nr:kelch motif family protein, putative [Ichthyophthirius multifiliis]EGR31395.1 kelch motif family protein, putative [Ichthyophthirius multifiliis]|eukprot:XP_004034881.1 kelch motif family protein, putative [Ichthyophthirius multifiliis]